MEHIKIKIIVSFLIPSILFIVASLPLVYKLIPPNCGYGFRLPKTLSNPDIWYKANAYGGTCMLLAGIATLLGCVWLWKNKEIMSLDSINLIGFGFFIGPVLIALALSLLYIKNL